MRDKFINSIPDTTLVLLCKKPDFGVGKQRLAREIGSEAAYKIAQHLLACAVEDLSRWQEKWKGSVVISPARAEDANWAKNLLSGAAIIPQEDGNLGQRINALDKTLHGQGHKSIIYIGSDCPLLTPEDYLQAVSVLRDNDTVLIPAEDGGVVLMGSRLPWPDLTSLPWSSSTLGYSLKSVCTSIGQTVTQFGLKADMDTREDALKILNALVRDERCSRKALQRCIRTTIKPKLSVIIPCFHNELFLEKLLIDLQKQTVSPDEILVVDAAQSTACKKICTEWHSEFNVRWVPSSPCRGKQLREGGEQASGDLLWFLHADAVLAGNPAKQIISAYREGADAGYFSFEFDVRAFPVAKPRVASWIEHLTRWRNQWGAVYGDQGIFVTRTAYGSCGGHTPDPLFEEVSLIRALRKKFILVELPCGLQINPRRWQKDGWIYRSLCNRLFAIAYSLGVSPGTLARIYSRQITSESMNIDLKNRSIDHA